MHLSTFFRFLTVFHENACCRWALLGVSDLFQRFQGEVLDLIGLFRWKNQNFQNCYLSPFVRSRQNWSFYFHSNKQRLWSMLSIYMFRECFDSILTLKTGFFLIHTSCSIYSMFLNFKIESQSYDANVFVWCVLMKPYSETSITCS